MENFICNDNFYTDILELSEDLFKTEQEIHDLDSEYKITCYKADLEPIIELDSDWIIERVEEDRWTMEGDEIDKVIKLLNKYCDFDKINKEIPKLYYEQYDEDFIITKQDFIDAL